MAAIGFGAKRNGNTGSDVAVNALGDFRSMVSADQPASESDVMRSSLREAAPENPQ